MLATNTSSIKSPPVWQATPQPSKLFAAIYWLLLLLALLALWQCPVSVGTRLLLIGITSAGGIKIFVPTCTSSTLRLLDDGCWQLQSAHGQTKGCLSAGSYRSQLLVVVAIRPETGSIAHAVVWRDSVPPSDFSFLHMHLAMTSVQQLP